MKHYHPVARPVSRDALARLGYDTRGFMPVNTRRSEQVVLDLFEIGVTNSAGFDADQDFPRPDPRNRDRFHLHHAGALVDGGPHRVNSRRLGRSAKTGSLQGTLPKLRRRGGNRDRTRAAPA